MLVTAGSVAVVRCEDENRVVLDSAFPDRIQHAPYAVIDQGDVTVVLGHHLLPPGPVLVLEIPFPVLAQVRRGLALERLVEIRPGRNGLRVVHGRIGFRDDVGEMGRDVVDAQEERLVSPRPLPQHFQANIGHLPGLALLVRVGVGAGDREVTPGKPDRRFRTGNTSPGPTPRPVTVEAEFLRPQVLVNMPLARIVERISRFLQSVAESRGIRGKSPAPGRCDVGIDHHPVIVGIQP